MAKRKKKIIDPFAEREAAKYEKPIASRECILQYLHDRGQPARRADIIKELGLNTEEEQEALRRRLRAMERDGQLIFTRRGGYGLVEKMNLIPGRIIGHRDGYGFLVPDDASKDLFLSAQQMRLVFNGDRALVRIKNIDRKGRREGEIVEVLERKTTELVGRFFIENNLGFVIPDNRRINQDIIIPPDQKNQAQHGQYVLVQITTPPTLRNQAVGSIREVLGDHMAPGMEIDVAIHSYNLPHHWPTSVTQAITNLTETVSSQDKQNRVDLRDKAFITIDGEDAKDFDDAVYCEKKSRGQWQLYVAIADVSHYVGAESPLDQEAKLRGNSVYFPGRVIPMLPEILSNGLCSLKANTDRLSLVCEMSINKSGKLLDYKFYEALIHSHARMTYSNVSAILIAKNPSRRKQYQKLLPHLENLYGLYKILKQKRTARGALDFDTVETKVIFREGRKIKEIVPYERDDAHKLIEECMLLANVAAAKFLAEHEIVGLYRVHEGPSEEKLNDLRKFLAEIGLSLRGGKSPRPKDYAHLIDEITPRDDFHLIQTVLLRSLSQAVYSPANQGHFGLAFEAYTHFTSPIRRYPDLLVHRAIKHILQKKSPEKFYSFDAMVKFGDQCSMTERRADEATRDVLGWLKCEYMQDRVGKEFDGIISGVTGFGLFIELKDIYVEGLLHITSLPNDYYHFDPIKHRLRGERTNMQFRLADPIRIKVVRVDLDNKQIDFALILPKKTKLPKTQKKSPPQKLKNNKKNKK